MTNLQTPCPNIVSMITSHDVWLEILQYLKWNELIKVGKVCVLLNTCSGSNKLWQRHLVLFKNHPVVDVALASHGLLEIDFTTTKSQEDMLMFVVAQDWNYRSPHTLMHFNN